MPSPFVYNHGVVRFCLALDNVVLGSFNIFLRFRPDYNGQFAMPNIAAAIGASSGIRLILELGRYRYGVCFKYS